MEKSEYEKLREQLGKTLNDKQFEEKVKEIYQQQK